MTAVLEFSGGTLRLRGVPREQTLEHALWDEREAVFRARAIDYRALSVELHKLEIKVDDQARAYEELSLAMRAERQPYPHQAAALAGWKRDRGRGVVVLPTGAGKTFVATLAISDRQRSTLVVVPTLDLMAQWHLGLSAVFDTQVGLIGGGTYDPKPLTVTTYDSAHLHMERLGNRFGLVIFDECHHLPSDAYATAARMCIAPFRLGLTATPERSDGREASYAELIGPQSYRLDINELEGGYLANYETVRLEVTLSTEEREQYERERATYISFVRAQGISMAQPNGWNEFVMRSSLSDAGRRAFLAYRTQRRLALAAPGKLRLLQRLLALHQKERVLIFTEENRTAHEISRMFLLPSITHQTKSAERANILRQLDQGELFAVVTSKVLNEGVDVPSASVAVVLSGSGSIREHVQRLGRILRKNGDKRAVLYELVARGTSEERTSDRRREHVAYK